MKKIEFDEQCPSCKGTGLFIGYAERNGAAVVCHTCKGTGKYHFVHEYEEFESRKIHPDAARVFETNPGIGIGTGNGHTLEEFGGMPVQDWLEGKPFPPNSEMRKYTCPRWWFQLANYQKCPDWDECYTALGCSFSQAKCFAHKDKCWKRYDKENRS